MIGDKFHVIDEHLAPGRGILSELISMVEKSVHPVCIGIGGESGSGKSTQAKAIQHLLEGEGQSVTVFHMDDYFFLPPKTNHQARLQCTSQVGPKEVDLLKLEKHIDVIKKGESKVLEKPLVNYQLDIIKTEIIKAENVDVVIVEGTYALSLENIDIKIFLSKSYLETKEARDQRGRDESGEFIEKILAIEHKIIVEHMSLADYILPNGNDVTSFVKPKL